MKRKPIKNRNVLVVGGAGFIGSHLVDQLLLDGAKQVIILDNLFIGTRDNLTEALDKGAILHIDNAENQEAISYLIEKYSIDTVFNSATKPLNYSFINPADAFITNILVLKNLLELQRKDTFQTLCHLSSSEAYGSAQYQPMDEGHPLKPLTTYAAGKAAADLMLESYVKMFNLDAFIVRPFNNYGPRQNYKGEMAGVIPLTIKNILEGKSPEIHGDGNQTRDYIYVRDSVEIILKAFPLISSGDCVNITVDQQTAIKKVVKSVTEVMKYRGEIVNKAERTADVQSHRGSGEKLANIVGQIQKTPFKEGIKDTVNWMKQVTGNE